MNKIVILLFALGLLFAGCTRERPVPSKIAGHDALDVLPVEGQGYILIRFLRIL